MIVDHRSAAAAAPARLAPMASIFRGSHPESTHYGVMAIASWDGRLLGSAGSSELASFPRSCLKPFQSAALLQESSWSTLRLSSDHLAVMCASHSGEGRHLALVRGILSRVGATESDLQCGANAPLDKDVARSLVAAGESATPAHNQCSGTHAGQLALARILGAPLGTYLDPAGPTQAQVWAAVRQSVGPPAFTDVGRDACRMPTFAFTVRAMASAYAKLAAATPSSAWHLWMIRDAMLAAPEIVAGPGRLESDVMSAAPGLVAKSGADGWFCVGHPQGLGLALKVIDGDVSERAIGPVVVAALDALGWLPNGITDARISRHGPVLALENWRGETTTTIRAASAPNRLGRRHRLTHTDV